jgi:hypothetical protein
MADRIVNALSTAESDQGLLSEGLTNKGLIGYIWNSQVQGSLNCIIIKIAFKNGNDYLYTTDMATETLTNLEFDNSGSLGRVFVTRRPNTVRLYRFFHKGRFEHLLITRPDIEGLLANGYRNESDGKPIYLLDRPISDSSPVYFYTNSDYTPKPFAQKVGQTIADESFSLADQKNELLEILEDNQVARERFAIVPDEQSLKVSINDTFHNFYVNLQENKEFFTISSIPAASTSDYIRHDISSWVNVVHEFQLWIDRVKRVSHRPSAILDINKAKGIVYLEGPSDFEFRNDNVKPVINVETQAAIFFKVIQGIKQGETGLLMGLFGRWGRGKTFFWRELKKKLNASTSIHFTAVEFHAWKYQDTPASWAYLYEQFASSFYKRPRFWACINFSFWNRVELNIKRMGGRNLLVGLIYLVFGGVWVFFFDFQFKWNLFWNLVSAIGASSLLSIAYYYFMYSGRARDLFKNYWSKVSFKGLLGIQAEMQREFQALMETWISKTRIGKERLILFVDDIDRCNEDRIIQVIDSLKVMIDDPIISDRVIVIAAIDEVVLKRAIMSKYFDSVKNDLSLSEDEKVATLNSLCKEYMDKLFISGFKLGSLSSEENEEIFRNLVDEKTFSEAVSSNQTAIDDNGTAGIGERSAENGVNVESAPIANPSRSILAEYIAVIPKTDFEIMGYELDFLVKAVRKFSNATPRAIRIFYYRYLLAKSFKDLLIKNDSVIYEEWHNNQDNKTILPLMMIEYSTQKRHEDLLIEIVKWEGSLEDDITVDVLGESFNLSRQLYLALLKTIEIVVPY